MKYKKIMLFFSFALPLCLILRYFQLNFIIETNTGFFKQEFEHYGFYMLAVLFAFLILTAVFSFTSHRSPEQPPRPNIFMSGSALLFGISIAFEIFGESLPQNIAPWQETLFRISGIIAIIYLALFAINKFIYIPFLDKASPLLAIYLICKIIVSFSSISSLALISDNILLLCAYCVCLLFSVNFAKVYNEIDTEKGFRKLLATGLCSVILCFSQAVPHIVYNASNGFNYLHTSMEANINILFMGLFIASFIFSHFSKKNACS